MVYTGRLPERLKITYSPLGDKKGRVLLLELSQVTNDLLGTGVSVYYHSLL